MLQQEKRLLKNPCYNQLAKRLRTKLHDIVVDMKRPWLKLKRKLYISLNPPFRSQGAGGGADTFAWGHAAYQLRNSLPHQPI